jgi:2-methylisocitrate lyase-like PEP mutase family enzyme
VHRLANRGKAIQIGTLTGMTHTVAEKRAAFRALHHQGCFVLPNPWDVGSARMLQHLGFVALASTSAGYAWTKGQPDYAMTCEGVLQHLASLCQAVDLPVNADFESGFAADPEGVARNVGLAIKTGVAGLSIEDRAIEAPFALCDKSFAVDRIRAAREAIDRSGRRRDPGRSHRRSTERPGRRQCSHRQTGRFRGGGC